MIDCSHHSVSSINVSATTLLSSFDTNTNKRTETSKQNQMLKSKNKNNNQTNNSKQSKTNQQQTRTTSRHTKLGTLHILIFPFLDMIEGSAESVSVDFETAGPAFAARLASLPAPLLPFLPLLPPSVAPFFVFNIVTSAHVTSAVLFPPPAPVSPSETGKVLLVPARVGDSDAAGATAVLVVPAGPDAGGLLAGPVVVHLDLDALLAGGELHVAAGDVRLPVRAAHHALVLAPLAHAEALARARPAGRGLGPVARPLAGHPDPHGRIAGGDAKVAARLVGDAVRAAHRPLPLAAPADVGAGAGA